MTTLERLEVIKSLLEILKSNYDLDFLDDKDEESIVKKMIAHINLLSL